MSNAIASPQGQGLVKAKSIAKFYDTTAATVYRWAKERKIPSVHFNGTVRFDFAKVREVIESGKGA